VLERASAECEAVDRALEVAASALAAPVGPSREVLRAVEARLSVQLRLARRTRPLSEVAFAMNRALERSRELLDRRVAAG
jgi:hypothetical protein